MGATVLDSATLHDRLTEQVGRQGRLQEWLDGTVLLDCGRGGVWTLRLDHGSVTLDEGASDEHDTHVATDARTLGDILAGSVSGIEAFLRGRLRVRGNLA